MKTVLITGCSTGIGRATAKYFQEKGWNVSATMRSPGKEIELIKLENVECFQLDVTRPESISIAVKKTIAVFGGLDLVINNAGYGTKGLFEAVSPEDARKQFDINVFGIMNVIWAALPCFREQMRGIIINISSQSGYLGTPLNSIYCASKFAVEGLSESLMYELASINIRVKLIEMGSISTNFASSSDFFVNPSLDQYKTVNDKVIPIMKKYLNNGDDPLIVAREIYKAATDGKNQLRYQAGKSGRQSYFLKKLLPFSCISKILKKRFGL